MGKYYIRQIFVIMIKSNITFKHIFTPVYIFTHFIIGEAIKWLKESNISIKFYYVIKFVRDLRLVGGFTPGTPVSFTNKTGSHDIAEILLKVTLNTITLTHEKTV